MALLTGGIPMKPQQKLFYDFAMKRVKPGSEKDLEVILNESFTKQDEGALTPVYLIGVVPKMIPLIRPECVDEFKGAAAKMLAQVKSK